MKFETLNEVLFGTLLELGKSSYSEIEEKTFKRLNQGANFFIEGTDQGLIQELFELYTLTKANQAFEGAPRVLWVVSSNERALAITKKLRQYIRRSEIAIEIANDNGKIIEQRNHIFEGADAIICNPRRMIELYNQNGFHVNQLKLVIIDDLESVLPKTDATQAIRRLFDSLPKCQKIAVCYGKHPKLEGFVEEWFSPFQTIDFL